MGNSGSGTVTPIVGPPGGTPSALIYEWEECALPLWKYAQLIHYSEWAFYGIAHPESEEYGCREIWNKHQRDEIARYLMEAQYDLEAVLSYPLCKRWFVDEQHKYTGRTIATYGKIISAGVQSVTTLQANAPVNLATNPAVVQFATALTVTDGIKVFYPNTSQEIFPFKMTITGGILYIEIPKARLVEWSQLDTPPEGLDYSDLSIYQTSVRVDLYVNDPSTNATLVWPHACNSVCAATGCSEYTHTACMYLRDGEKGLVDTVPAVYSSGAWTAQGCNCKGIPSYVRLNYYAGPAILSRLMETAIVRLAHSKMADPPCGCEDALRLWKRDTTVPQFLTRERLECPFGINDGAWLAWKFANSEALVRIGSLR